MGRRRSKWPNKKNAGMLIGAAAVAGLLYYMFADTKKVAAHPNPRVGRGYGATPYGSPAGNPGLLRGLGSKQGCGCHSGGIHL